MLIDKSNASLLVVDIQEKLLPKVLEPEQLVNNCYWLIRAALDIQLPVIITEQYPQGLGMTTPKLKQLISPENIMEKMHFSVCADKGCASRVLDAKKNQLIIIGMETSVCVLQTALEFMQKGLDIFVVVDAVSGRHQLDHDIALSRMKQAGVNLVTKEMVFFECLKTSGSKQFKTMIKKFFN